jgi:serine/threonine protein kinase
MPPSADQFDSKLLLGRYRVVRLLGEGGMGTVYLARVEGAEGFTRPVVVKRMRTDLKATEEGHRLFIREAQILSKLQHPGIINIIDFGVEEGAHIMVLEYVHGYTLAPWLDYLYAKGKKLPVDMCLFIVRRVLDALHYAHNFDSDDGKKIEIVHRDVAPDNVLLSKKGYVHLLDFGVASMTGTGRGVSTKSGVFRGKLGYAAPETVEGAVATPRSDQYSAAILLLELLIQETPFFSESIGETVIRMVNETPPAPSSRRDDIPPGLDAALARALEKKPAARYDSALELSRELRKFQVEDDEEVAEALRKRVQDDFEALPEVVDVEPLKVREEALARIFPKGLQSVVLDSQSAALERAAAEAILAEARARAANLPQENKKIQGLLLGLLVVGGLIALGLGAAVALLSKGDSGEQVVVVGGEQDELSRGLVRADEPFQKPAAGLEPVPATDMPKEPASLRNDGQGLSRQQKLSLAVQQRSADFQSCFLTHLGAAETSPEAILHFSVSAKGGTPQVSVEPPQIAATKLGDCLKDAAGKVTFPELDQGVSFRVPVRARVARFDKEE